MFISKTIGVNSNGNDDAVATVAKAMNKNESRASNQEGEIPNSEWYEASDEISMDIDDGDNGGEI